MVDNYYIGEYLELSRTSLPTPPSSPENTGDTGFPESRVVTTYTDHYQSPPRGQGEVTYRPLPPVPVQRENSEPGYYHTKYQDPSTLAREIGLAMITFYCFVPTKSHCFLISEWSEAMKTQDMIIKVNWEERIELIHIRKTILQRIGAVDIK